MCQTLTGWMVHSVGKHDKLVYNYVTGKYSNLQTANRLYVVNMLKHTCWLFNTVKMPSVIVTHCGEYYNGCSTYILNHSTALTYGDPLSIMWNFWSTTSCYQFVTIINGIISLKLMFRSLQGTVHSSSHSHSTHLGMFYLIKGRFLQSLLSSRHCHLFHSLVTVLSIRVYWNLLWVSCSTVVLY